VITRICPLVAGIYRAGHQVVAIRRNTRLAVVHEIASFRSVAKQTVVARAVVGHMLTGVAGVIAGVGCTRDAVVTVVVIHALAAHVRIFVALNSLIARRIHAFAPVHGVAHFRSVAEQTVIRTVGVVGCMDAAAVNAGVVGTTHTVIAITVTDAFGACIGFVVAGLARSARIAR
jgi:hypothetical protein